jgi:hypothetical protein
MLFNGQNIWANIQQKVRPHEISYDLSNGNMWSPLFNKSMANMETLKKLQIDVSPLQSKIPYTFPRSGSTYYKERAEAIERIVEEQFERHRETTTKWDYGVCKVLRDHLNQFEQLKQVSHSPIHIHSFQPLSAFHFPRR